MRRAMLCALVAACDDGDPCAGVDNACVALTVKSQMFEALDELELDILYDDRHDTITTALPGATRVKLPVTTQIVLDLNRRAPVGIVAAGKLAGATFGFGEGEQTLGADEHATLTIELGPKTTCEPNQDFCGGDGFAGNVQTMYRCTAGVPRARGRCAHGCERRGGNDVCLAGPEACSLGGYCGGNEVEGDPSSVYTCSNGKGIDPVPCANGCVIETQNDDHCR